MVPEQPIRKQDPIVSKSFALHYVVSMVILMATLFWALWDEDYSQRPWKGFQREWKQRYSTFLKTAESKSVQSEKSVEQSAEYQQVEQDYQQVFQAAKPHRDELQKQILDLNGRILAIQHVFVDKRAYVNALTYQIETETSASAKESKRKKLEDYKKETWSVEYPDGHQEKYAFPQLVEKYNELRDERTKLSAELGEVLKPVTAASTKVSAYINQQMVDLTPAQIDGLKRKTKEWEPKIVQINVAEANIVDRCESCHMGIREPLTLTAASMAPQGKKPDEYARAFTSHPEPGLLKTHDPEKFGCSPCHQGNGRATTGIEKAHGNYEHWLWPLFPSENAEAGLSDLPRRGHGTGEQRRRLDDQRGQGLVSTAGLRRLPSL